MSPRIALSPGSPPDRTSAVEAVGLTRCFGPLTAVDHLELSIPRGTIFGLLGPNGAGKTTTVKMLTTLLPPTGGTARVAGFDVVREPREVRRRVGYVPQLLSADSSLTGRENLSLSGKLYGIPARERRARIDEALAFLELAGFADVLVRKYSGGMIRRLEIAQALLHRPPVLFLDEPTMGLDPVARRAVWERLEELRARAGTAMLLCTHDMEEAEVMCETVAIMHEGRLVAQGAPSALEAEIGPDASMSDVFVRCTGGIVEHGGDYRDVARTRRAVRRRG